MSIPRAATAASLAAVTPGRWALDPARSSIGISHRGYWGLMAIKGRFAPPSGEAEVLADGSARGWLTVDATSVDTGIGLRDGHLRAEHFFDVAAHPTFVYAADRAVAVDETSVHVTGALTVRGVTRPLGLTARVVDLSADRVVLRAEVEVDRSEFGITWNPVGMMHRTTAVTVTACFVRAS